jgi:hypothetical protein
MQTSARSGCALPFQSALDRTSRKSYSKMLRAYVFRGDALGTILFEIETVDPLALYGEFADEMQKIYAKTGRHAAWAESKSSAAVFLSARDVRGYRVSSSIGLEGAVWARQLSIRTASRQAH